MDLTFQKTPVSYLQKLFSQVSTREETAEILLSDQDPDIGRVVSAWALPVVRSRDLRTGEAEVSGGITAWALYIPADGSEPRTASAYLPFTMKWDLPGTQQIVSMRVHCQTQSVDARMTSARKLLFRTTIACQAEVFTPAEAEFYSLSEAPQELEALRQHIPLLLPTEICDKQFQLEDPLDLPGGAPAVSRIISYQLSPGISESKVMGEKAVFKGSCQIHLVYLTPEARLSVWDFDVPFSQYTELSRHYEQEEELQCVPLVTAAELDIGDDGRQLQLKCGLCIQCAVWSRQNVEMITDLYSPHYEMTPHTATVPIRTRLDHQQLRQQAEIPFPVQGCTPIDLSVLSAFPKVDRSGDTAIVEVPVWCSMLYYDETGALQGRSGRANTTTELTLASGCPCHAASQLSGQAQWSADSSGMIVRVPLELTVDSFSNEEMTMLSSAVSGEKRRLDPNRPSVILRAPTAGETLWDMAKRHGSTVDAIQKANQLTSGSIEQCGLLLIPII